MLVGIHTAVRRLKHYLSLSLEPTDRIELSTCCLRKIIGASWASQLSYLAEFDCSCKSILHVHVRSGVSERP